jgi:ABC-type multidrug transport system ATPase subunit
LSHDDSAHHSRAGPGEVVQAAGRAARRGLRRGAGSIFALLGSNGAGKTTLVKILSTLLEADAGTASVDGFDVTAQPAGVRDSISLTGQFAAVDEILSGRENLVLVARLRHLEDPGRSPTSCWSASR